MQGGLPSTRQPVLRHGQRHGIDADVLREVLREDVDVDRAVRNLSREQPQRRHAPPGGTVRVVATIAADVGRMRGLTREDLELLLS